MKFSDLDVGHVVLTKYKGAEYSDVFRVAVLEKSPNSLYFLNEYKYWSKDFDTYRKVWESVEHLENTFEIVDCLGRFIPELGFSGTNVVIEYEKCDNGPSSCS